MRLFHSIVIVLLTAAVPAPAAGIERIWLTHQSPDPGKLVVNWESQQAGNSVVEFGASPALGEQVVIEGRETLHHVEIPLHQHGGTYHYRVRTGEEASEIYRFKGYPEEELRIAVIGDAGYANHPWGAAILRENPHLLVSAGDNVPALHKGTPVAPEDFAAFRVLIAQWPELFHSTPFIPALGNHDREIRPRGPKPPAEPVYDVEAKAFRAFFALPGAQWHWSFDLPQFGLRLIALDLSHLSDMGTTWQTCHPYARDGEQFAWYERLMAQSSQPFVVTLYNERNANVRALEGGEWGRLIRKGTAAITGFGYFGERAEIEKFPFYNTSLSGTGTPYPDPMSVALKREDNFVLLTVRHRPSEMKIELKNLAGEVLDRREFRAQASP